MTRFKLLGAATLLSLLSATPALAQPVIDEPGMFAFNHPVGDLGIASSRPPADAMAMVQSGPRTRPRIVMKRHVRPDK